jgi:hypothetical protein
MASKRKSGGQGSLNLSGGRSGSGRIKTSKCAKALGRRGARARWRKKRK